MTMQFNFFYPWQSLFSIDTKFQNLFDKWTYKIFIAGYFVFLVFFNTKKNVTLYSLSILLFYYAMK